MVQHLISEIQHGSKIVQAHRHSDDGNFTVKVIDPIMSYLHHKHTVHVFEKKAYIIAKKSYLLSILYHI